jgi:hypothetical protein
VLWYYLGMGLNRVQKRNLAIVLVAQAQEVVEDWHSYKQKHFPGVPDDALAELSQDDVRHRFAGWLQYLPGKPAASMLLGESEEIDSDAQHDIVETVASDANVETASDPNDPNAGIFNDGQQSSDQSEPEQPSYHSSYAW